MATVMKLTQSGGGSTVISADPGDTITFLLPSTVQNKVLAAALAPKDVFVRIADVTFAASYVGNGSYALTLTQSGSGSTAIDAASGDTVTIELASVVENDVLAAFNAYLQALTPVTGVNFAINTDGEA